MPQHLIAWGVHAFTASGMLVGFIALDRVIAGEIFDAILLLWLTVLIDGLDGTFARRFHVREVLPGFDGKMLDYVIDYANFVLIPCVILQRSEMVPVAFTWPCVAGILYASLYHYGNRNQITADYRFRGFPAFWNLVIYYLFILQLGQCANLMIVATVILLHFLPVPFVYASRQRRNVVPVILSCIALLGANAWVLASWPEVGTEMRMLTVIPLLLLLILGWVPRELFPSLARPRGNAS